eukprot:Clim_evm27s15 gene=Clim_evmTU27s15
MAFQLSRLFEDTGLRKGYESAGFSNVGTIPARYGKKLAFVDIDITDTTEQVSKKISDETNTPLTGELYVSGNFVSARQLTNDERPLQLYRQYLVLIGLVRHLGGDTDLLHRCQNAVANLLVFSTTLPTRQNGVNLYNNVPAPDEVSGLDSRNSLGALSLSEYELESLLIFADEEVTTHGGVIFWKKKKSCKRRLRATNLWLSIEAINTESSKGGITQATYPWSSVVISKDSRKDNKFDIKLLGKEVKNGKNNSVTRTFVTEPGKAYNKFMALAELQTKDCRYQVNARNLMDPAALLGLADLKVLIENVVSANNFGEFRIKRLHVQDNCLTVESFEALEGNNDEGKLENGNGEQTQSIYQFLSAVHSMLISRNPLTRIPRNLKFLSPNLKVLDISSCGLQTLDDAACMALPKTITAINFMANGLKDLPEGLSDMPALRNLNVSYNVLEHIPDVIFNIPKLDKLTLSGNAIVNSGVSGWSRLNHVRTVDLRNNAIIDFPDELVLRCPTLQSLNLSYNRISLVHLPEVDNVLELDFSGAALKDVKLAGAKLMKLNLSNSNVASLANLSACPMVRHLNCTSCRIVSIPRTLGEQFRALESLFLWRNKIKDLPVDLFTMPRLKWLGLADNEISSLPEELPNTKLAPLARLELQGNRLDRVPDWLGQFHCLDIVNFTSNQLYSFPLLTLPESIKEIYLACNRLDDALWDGVSPQYFPILGTLDVSHNLITELPGCVEGFQALRQLRGYGNPWKSFSVDICKLRSLRHLMLTEHCNQTGSEDIYDCESHAESLRQSIPKAVCPRCPISVFPGSSKDVPDVFAKKLHFGVSNSIGMRNYMEDRSAVSYNLPRGCWLMAVFDGHGGSDAVETLCDVFPTQLEQNLGELTEVTASTCLALTTYQCIGAVSESLRELRIHTINKEGTIKEILQARDASTSGSTMAACLFEPIDEGTVRVHTINVGDCEAVLYCSSGILQETHTLDTEAAHPWVHSMSTKHYPNNDAEHARIRRAGGYISSDVRVQGYLAVGRSIGDFEFYPSVSPEPSLKSVDVVVKNQNGEALQLNPERLKESMMLIVSSDGLWDAFSPHGAYMCAQEAASHVPEHTSGSGVAQAVADALCDGAWAWGSPDNTTIMVAIYGELEDTDDHELNDIPEEEGPMNNGVHVHAVDVEFHEEDGDLVACSDGELPLVGANRLKHLGRDYSFERWLGVGSFGQVFLAKASADGSECAVKVIKKGKNLKALEDARREARICMDFDHPHLISVHRAFESEANVYIMMEVADCGYLGIPDSPENALKDKYAKPLIAQLVSVLHYLHVQGLVYRDLALHNILISRKKTLKLADLGLAVPIQDLADNKDNCQGQIVGTPAFMAPEMLMGEPYGKGIDWWAVGMILYTLLVGRPPFLADDRNALFDQIRNREIYFPKMLSKDASKLLQGLLIRDPKRRLGSTGDESDLMHHSYFRTINWDSLNRDGGKELEQLPMQSTEEVDQDRSFQGWL